MSVQLAEKIRTHYGELPRLKSSFSATALGMFSNGWVWFVTDTGGELGILPTFGPSTLLIRSRANMNYINGVLGDVDVESASSLPRAPPPSPFSKTPPPSNMMPPSPEIDGADSLPISQLQHSLHASSDVSENADAADRHQSVGDVIYPLFCLPVYEHAWMSAGFGVWGKEDWLKEFWTVLDWGKVSIAFDHALKRHVKL